MNQDQKNLYLAFALSILVFVGWNYFYGAPTMEKTRQTQIANQNPPTPVGTPAQPGAPVTPGAPVAPVPAVAVSRAEALAASPRVTIDTASLKGSIALKGGRIDDISLKGYHETIDPQSPIIELFSPAGSPKPYNAETGFIGAPGTPDAASLWTADAERLTAARPLTLSFDNGAGLVFRREIAVDDEYMFTIKDSVENKSEAAISLQPYALVRRTGKPVVAGYAVLHEGLLGVVGDSRIQEITYDGIEKEPGGKKSLDGKAGWVGITDKYWAGAVIPDQNVQYKGGFSAFGAPGTPKTYQADTLSEALSVPAAGSASVTTRIFAGAKVSQVIDRYGVALGIRNFDLMIDWGWFYFITKPLFKLIDLIYKLVGNFGLAILIVTVIVKAAFFPLANRSYLSMAKMKAVQPQLAALKERFPDDKQKQQQEQMALFKKEKINPVAGCLPMLLQVPVFFALYKVIFVTIEMRHAPFYGWIHDLSAPDPTNIFTLFGLLPFDPTHIPVFGQFLGLGIWPIIMGISMFVQMKMNPEPTDPTQKLMFAWMPLIFTFMLGSFPAGLVIYWTWNNILSVSQQGLIMKRAGVKIELWDNLKSLLGGKPAAKT